ncbi:MAG: OB-fold nucleic acid binding domain-containing protein [Nitrosomonadales bacterium]|nr:OB-fold nucleic acid binding domain-containing protein [Nitrosomonadales bacterium]
MKMRSIVFAGLVCTLGLASFNASAADNLKTVAAVNENMATLAGQTVSVQGKVVKVNRGIMKRNFIHVQDGTGDANTNNLIFTSKQIASVGDQVTISGVVVLNRDFGGGYMYPLLVEDASIAGK